MKVLAFLSFAADTSPPVLAESPPPHRCNNINEPRFRGRIMYYPGVLNFQYNLEPIPSPTIGLQSISPCSATLVEPRRLC